MKPLQMLCSVSVCLAALISPLWSQERVKTKLVKAPGQEVLTEVTRAMKADADIKGPGGEFKDKLVAESELRVIDVLEKLGESSEVGKRLYLSDRATENKIVADSERNGLEFRYTTSEEGTGAQRLRGFFTSEEVSDDEAICAWGLTAWLSLPRRDGSR